VRPRAIAEAFGCEKWQIVQRVMFGDIDVLEGESFEDHGIEQCFFWGKAARVCLSDSVARVCVCVCLATRTGRGSACFETEIVSRATILSKRVKTSLVYETT